MCTVLMPPGDNPTAVNKYIKLDETGFIRFRKWTSVNSM